MFEEGLPVVHGHMHPHPRHLSDNFTVSSPSFVGVFFFSLPSYLFSSAYLSVMDTPVLRSLSALFMHQQRVKNAPFSITVHV